MTKYSPAFDRDFNWLLSVRHFFDFAGRPEIEVAHDRNGVDGKQAFLVYDSQGKIKPCRHPRLLQALILTKASVNLHIKMYAEDRAKGLMTMPEFRRLCTTLNAPTWFADAVNRQMLNFFIDIQKGNRKSHIPAWFVRIAIDEQRKFLETASCQ